jgi:hypothetical protein
LSQSSNLAVKKCVEEIRHRNRQNLRANLNNGRRERRINKKEEYK